MSTQVILYDALLLGLVFLCSIPFGKYITKVFEGKKNRMTRFIKPIETKIYKVLKVEETAQMNAKQYVFAVLATAFIGFLFVFVFQLIQPFLPGNPNGMESISLDVAFNSAVSFVTNTNWQGYSGEMMMSHSTQMLAFTVQNFVSAATGIAILFVLIRGFIQKETNKLGNYFVDLTRIILYVLLPSSIILCLFLVSQGVVQTLQGDMNITTISGANQVLPFGPAASQIAIKQLGSNGGGFFGANSAFPFENPNALSNFVEMFSILILPVSLIHTFGHSLKDKRQGRTLFIVMAIIFVAMLVVITYGEMTSAGFEGKEIRFGSGSSALWASITTAVSSGSSNAALDSFSAIALFGMMFLMQIGEVAFGGVGSGIYGMIAFVILTIFMAGLMVGRTPEYLRKKIGTFEMKMVCFMILIPPLAILVASAITLVIGNAGLLQTQGGWLGNDGTHGFIEILYSFTSMAANNGSSLNGLDITQPYFQIIGGIIMLVTRFIPIIATIYLAGSLAKKKEVPVSEGSLSTTSPLFCGFLLLMILIIGALTFLPALALGPIAEFLG